MRCHQSYTTGRTVQARSPAYAQHLSTPGPSGSSKPGRCETREGALRESTAFSSAEARRLDQTHRHENAFPSALGEFRKSKLTRIRRKIRAGFSGVWNRTWLFRP